jgi:hypothetical protein
MTLDDFFDPHEKSCSEISEQLIQVNKLIRFLANTGENSFFYSQVQTLLAFAKIGIQQIYDNCFGFKHNNYSHISKMAQICICTEVLNNLYFDGHVSHSYLTPLYNKLDNVDCFFVNDFENVFKDIIDIKNSKKKDETKQSSCCFTRSNNHKQHLELLKIFCDSLDQLYSSPYFLFHKNKREALENILMVAAQQQFSLLYTKIPNKAINFTLLSIMHTSMLNHLYFSQQLSSEKLRIIYFKMKPVPTSFFIMPTGVYNSNYTTTQEQPVSVIASSSLQQQQLQQEQLQQKHNYNIKTTTLNSSSKSFTNTNNPLGVSNVNIMESSIGNIKKKLSKDDCCIVKVKTFTMIYKSCL